MLERAQYVVKPEQHTPTIVMRKSWVARRKERHNPRYAEAMALIDATEPDALGMRWVEGVGRMIPDSDGRVWRYFVDIEWLEPNLTSEVVSWL